MERADNQGGIAERHELVESRMRWKSHVRFGGRAGETDRWRQRHGAPVRSHVGNRCLDTVRRRIQNETLGHRGRKGDPLYRIPKIMLTAAERLDDPGHERMLLGLRFGDPHDEVLGAWLAKESVRDLYLTNDPAEAAVLLDKTIAGCLADEVAEIRSLGKTLRSWRAEILAHHDTGASNGPTEGLNLCVKRVKRAGHGSVASSTTGSASSSTPAASPGPTVTSHPGSAGSPHSNA
jgi:hypothetical protein